MAPETDDFDPTARGERDIGREMVDQSTGMGSVVAHLYRAEMDRMVSWRERLDSTTNWAVTLISGILAYAFSSEDVAHSILLVAMGVAVVFLLMESTRFRRYDIWRSRARSMQENLFANALDPSQGVEQRDWRRQLSADYRRPAVKMTFFEAVRHRLRRVYLPLLGGLLVVWLVRLNGADEPMVAAAGISNTPGWIVVGFVAASYVALFAVAFWPNAAAPTETDETADRGDLDREE